MSCSVSASLLGAGMGCWIEGVVMGFGCDRFGWGVAGSGLWEGGGVE